MRAARESKNGYVPLPAAFVERVGREVPGLVEALDGTEPPVSVRFNPAKPYTMPADDTDGQVAWAEVGETAYLARRPVFTTDPAFHGGAYYVQEAGSMFVGWLLRRCRDAGLLEADGKGLRVLDLCAAPGGKTTHLASIVAPWGGIVIANEVIRPRAKTLAENVQKWGTDHVAVVSNDPAEFGERLPDFFDLVVIDAPCSGEGMFRKDFGARAEWSPENVLLCAARQRRIVSDAWATLRPGGILIYSTCTFNTVENEENVRWVAERLGGEVLTFDHLPEGIVPGKNADGPTLGWHFYPHRVRSEGFFAAAIRKTAAFSSLAASSASKTTNSGKKRGATNSGLTPLSANELREVRRWVSTEALPAAGLEHFVTGGDGSVYGFSTALHEAVTTLLSGRFALLYSGVQLGELIRGSLKPAHALALYPGLNRQAIPVTELSETEALEYLRKGSSTTLLPPDRLAEGLNLVTFQQIPLGWVKRIGRRYNNLYPPAWRILHY